MKNFSNKGCMHVGKELTKHIPHNKPGPQLKAKCDCIKHINSAKYKYFALSVCRKLTRYTLNPPSVDVISHCGQKGSLDSRNQQSINML
jgi:hypothetical protein